MSALRWSYAEALERAAAPGLLEPSAVDAPLIIIEPGPGDPAFGSLARSPALVALDADIGAAETDLLAAVDIAATGEELDAVIGAVEANPLAATILGQTLRLTSPPPGLSPTDLSPTDLSPAKADDHARAGLVVESLAYATLQAGPEFARWLDAQGRRTRPPETEPAVLVADHGAHIDITLNRPRLRNALNTTMRDGLRETLATLAHRPETDIVIRGAGSAFCIGGDLAEFGTVADPATAHAIRQRANVAPALLAVADRTTVEVHGACIGAGLELAAFAGHVRAAADATFALPEVSMGLIPGAGGTVSVPRRIGRQRTAYLAVTGERLDVHTALAWGLVDEVV